MPRNPPRLHTLWLAIALTGIALTALLASGYWTAPPLAAGAGRSDVSTRATLERRADRPQPPGATGGASPADAGREGAPEPAAKLAPLPPLDLPLAQSYDELARQARAGNARAACRLALQLNACRSLPTLRRRIDLSSEAIVQNDPKRKLKEEELKTRIDVIARNTERFEKLDSLCSEVESRRLDEAFDWQLLAARRGDAVDRVRFVTQPMIPYNRQLQLLDQLKTYREEAPALAIQALEDGSPQMIEELRHAYASKGDGFGWLMQVMPDDPVQAYAMSILGTELGLFGPGGTAPSYIERADRQLKARLDAAQLAQARSSADRMRREYFAHYVPDKTPKPAAPSKEEDWSICDRGR